MSDGVRKFVAAIVWSLFAFSMAACLESPAVTCKNGLICAPGNVCDDAHGGCATSSQIVACSGKAEETACSYQGVTEGACYSGVCLPAGCGNGVMSGDEVCDDGNRIHGDGCSADCRSLETCGNGIIDEITSEQCDDGNLIDGDTCQSTCRSPRCGDGIKDVADNEACDKGAANSELKDAECRTNCQPGRCGDTVIDTGEICDDGNLAAKDGCTPDCLSDETCGNDYTDLLKGELCDDGDALSHDGCGGCQIEKPVWTQQSGALPDARSRHALAYDASRGRVVMFGGRNGGRDIDETWEWNGVVWTNISPSPRPAARHGHALAYDARRHRVVMFGGIGNNAFNDTWEWEGTHWVAITPKTTAPPARSEHSLAYDAVRGQVVLFGGVRANGTLLNDTWVWNGVDWTEVTPTAGSPPARKSHAIAYDPLRARVVLFGGELVGGRVGDTWEWNGTSWSDVTLGAGNPPARSGHAISFDAQRGRIVIQGGSVSGAAAALADTWEWDGAAWTNVTAASNLPYARIGHAIAYDAARARMVLFGGAGGELMDPTTDSYFGDTWERSDTVWTSSLALSPPASGLHAVAYDTARQRLVVFSFNQTWEWDGNKWLNRTPASGNPPPRMAGMMGYDAARAKVVLFGGCRDEGSCYNDTWTWNGTTWLNVTPSSGNPPLRAAGALAYDSTRGRLVLFGGYGVNRLSDTWEWNGTTWTNLTPASNNPEPRAGHGMTYDLARGRVVLFGGLGDGPSFPQTTWTWNGTAWSNVTPPSGNPPPRATTALSYDVGRSRVVMFGGEAELPTGKLNDTWEWNGSAWTKMTPVSGIPTTRGATQSLVYSPTRNRLVLVGGNGGSGRLLADTWEWSGTEWSDATTARPTPKPRMGHQLAYDSGRGRIVTFGGRLGDGSNTNDTWERREGAWFDVTPTSGSPTARRGYGLAYDAARKRVVLFGGWNGSTSYGDTWEWNGTAWTQITPATGAPPSRYYPALAYDASRKRVVMFGGQGNNNLNDTWEWDGVSWVDKTPTTASPSARSAHALAYDAARKRVVLFGGGIAQGGAGDDTWEWDGVAWTNTTPAFGNPAGREYHTLGYDASRARVLLFGGVGTNGQFDDLWEWDGMSWTPLTTATSPVARQLSAVVYDELEQSLVLFGGNSGLGALVALGDTWTLRYQEAADESCLYGVDGDNDRLVGCNDPDCFGYCTPLCNPTIMTCDPASPHCGDGTCQPLETHRLCPVDCTTPTPVCGDFVCDSSETIANCPGDCSP